MSCAEDLLAQIEQFAAASPLPRVRALHLPPLRPVYDHAEFFALELEDGAIGLSYALLDHTLEDLNASGPRQRIAGADPLALARGHAHAKGIAKTVGFAAINALTRALYDRAGFVPPPAGDSIGAMAPAPGDHVGMIGLFRPLLARVVASGARLTVIELNERLAGAREGYVVTLDRRALAGCNKVVATSTLLLNDTLDDMLAACRAARWFALIGPTAGCLPDALFARGVTLIGGNWIVDGRAFIDALRAGERTGPFSRKYALTRAGYPGFEALSRRAAGRSRPQTHGPAPDS
jgi:uncharacterized protein (DUF4213/DUF364 family)